MINCSVPKNTKNRPNDNGFSPRRVVVCDLIIDAYRRGLHLVTGSMLKEDREKDSDE